MISQDPWVWISAILTLCSFSLMYGDNKFFRFSEYTYTAVVIGHAVVIGIQTLGGRLQPLFSGQQPSLIISLVLGLMVLFVAYKKYAWIASTPYAVIIGVGTGLSMRAVIATDVVANMRAVIAETGLIFVGTPFVRLGYFIRVTFTIGAMFYFLYTVFLTGPTSKPAKLLREFGKYALLIFLGLALGNSAMQYSGLATSSINRLLCQWLGLG